MSGYLGDGHCKDNCAADVKKNTPLIPLHIICFVVKKYHSILSFSIIILYYIFLTVPKLCGIIYFSPGKMRHN